MSLKLWLEKGWLKEHKPTSREIAELLAVADRALRDCQIPELSSEGKLNMAHNAALQSSTAALAAAGYKSSREAYHYYVIESLSFTLRMDGSIIRSLHKLRRKRNISDYERPQTITEQEARDMIRLAKLVCQQVEEWIRNNYKELAEEI